MKMCLLRLSLFLTAVLSLSILEGASAQKSKEQHRIITEKEIALQEEKLIRAINQVRRQHGRNALSTWNTLSYYAKQHSQDMADGYVEFGHEGFEARADNIQKTSPCYSVGENVAYSYLIDDPLKKAVEMWMKSPHHRDNILGDYRETGMGIAYDRDGRCFITQLFSKQR